MRKRGVFFSAATPPLDARHDVSGLNSVFNGEQLPFAEYISTTRDMIRKVRAAGNSDHPDQSGLNKAVEGNSPFALEPLGADTAGRQQKYRRGILLTHGLSDSPYFMRHIAAVFQENGFRVLAVLLPGHGTRPGDLLNVRWQEWARAVAYGTNILAAEVDEIYLGGFSAGGALSIFQSLQDNRVRGLFLFAPALEISHRAAYANLHRLGSWLLPRARWVEIKPDIDIYKYESFAKNIATQMYQLTRVLRDRLKMHQLITPVFTVASAEDKTVSVTAIFDFMAQQHNFANKFILYSADKEKLAQNLQPEKVERVNSLLPDQKILSSAHTAILLPAEDEHYGVNGDYANCAHYYPDNMEKYAACIRNPEACWLGEITEKNLAAGILRRLMYNPHFPELKHSIKCFIDSLTL